MDQLQPSSLAAALSTNSLLRAHLAHAHTRLEHRKRLRQLDDERTADTSPDAIRSRERDLEHRLASLQRQLARERAQHALEHGIERASVPFLPTPCTHAAHPLTSAPSRSLEQSHLVSTHLSSLSPSTPASSDHLCVPLYPTVPMN